MTHGMLAASTVAIVGIGLMLSPAETFATPGGLAAARAPAFHGGFRPGGALVRPGFVRPSFVQPSFVRPAFARPHAPRPAVAKPLVRGPVGVAYGGATVRMHTAHRPHHRRAFGGFGFGGPYDYGTFYPVEYAVPIDYVAPDNWDVAPNVQQPAAYPTMVGGPARGPDPERVRLIVHRPNGCDVQTYVVPSEAGGTRRINIVRC
jgi:hypothetical protein